jgi:hypothetical protein
MDYRTLLQVVLIIKHLHFPSRKSSVHIRFRHASADVSNAKRIKGI